MPFVVPNIPEAFGSRQGTTGLFGSLTPTQSGTVSRLSAALIAYPPLGVITTTVSWGFITGPAPPGTTTLIVSAIGTTREQAQSYTFGGYASAIADISITVEQFVRRRNLPPGGFSLVFERSFNSGLTPIFNLTNWGVGVQDHNRNGTASTVFFTAITPGQFYRCWINSVQSASCGVAGGATSNFSFDMEPVFFSFI